MSSKKHLCESITHHLSLCPEDSVDLLQAVTEGLKLYSKAVEERRSNQSRIAITGLYHFIGKKKSFSNYDRITLMDGLFFTFPSGRVNGHCVYDKEALSLYIQLYKQQVDDKEKFDSWLESTRGKEWVVWHDSLLENNC